ncbi:leucine-rich repeat domain-containing protein, partial [Flavivirga sp. 57AJ16]|uniref:leucine-rich repeat domain-containing protein n=1 Tax=Flavivirga sp. 57AJ16 TaxID=3025307 RepID=UPI0023659175
NYVKTGETSAIVIKSPNATGAIEILKEVPFQGIPCRVTAIEEAAFGSNALTSVTIPDSVTAIGDYAFYNNGLTSVTIPDNVTAIGAFVFTDNYLLEKVMAKGMTPATIYVNTFPNRAEIALIIPEGTKEAYEAAGWTGFKSITEDDEVLGIITFEIDAINYRVTSSKEIPTVEIKESPTATGAIDIPETVTHQGITYRVTAIGANAFFNNGVTSVTIPDSVTTIGDYAFSHNALTSVTIPNSVTTIGRRAFQYGTLTSVTIPDSVTAIDHFAFKNNALTSVIIGNSVTTIGDYVFENNALTRVTIGHSVTAIGAYAFYGNNALEKVFAKGTTPATILATTFIKRENIELIIPEGTKADYEAAGWTGFKSITEDDDELGIITFEIDHINYRVTSLEGISPTVEIKESPNATGAIDIPETVTHQGITYRVTAIGHYAFYKKGLTSVTIPDSVTAIGNFAFYYNGLTSVIIPDSVTAIGDGAFAYNALTSVTIPDSVTAIGGYAFANNSLDKVFAKGTTPASIVSKTFSNRSKIALIIPEGTKEAYEAAGWTGFKSIIEDDELLNIFEINHINYLVTSTEDIPAVEIKASPNAAGAITIPKEVTHQGITYRVTAIDDFAFRDNGVTSVVIPESVTAIGRGAFGVNGLRSVTIPESVTAIGDYAFSGNPLIEVIVQSAIPASIEDTSFGNRAIVYLNVPESFKQNYINLGWTGFQDRPVETFTQDNVNYVKTGETSAIVIKSPNATGAIEILKEVPFQGIPCRVTAIEEAAFGSNALTSVTIPDSVTAIGDYAFYNNGLTSVTIPDNVTAIGAFVFTDNYLLEKVMAKGMTPATIYVNTFPNRAEIALIIPEGTKEAYEAAGWTGFKSITEDNEVLGIITFEVDDINYLVTSTEGILTVETTVSPNAVGAIDIPEVVTHQGIAYRVTAISGYAFYDKALTSVTIPDKVTVIGEYAFGSNALEKVIVKDMTPATIYSNTFLNRAEIALMIPVGTKAAYETAGWTGFKSIAEVDIITFEIDDINYLVTSTGDIPIVEIKDSPNATGAINIPETVTHQGVTYRVTAISGYAFNKNALTSVTIPDSVTAIDRRAFEENTLTSVTIPDKVTVIGAYAFATSTLEKVIVKGTAPATIYSNTFLNRAEIALIIPEGTKAAYEAAGWTGFKSITEDDEVLGTIDKDLNTSVHLILNDSYLKIQSTQANLKAYAIYNILGVNILKGTANKVAIDRLSSGMYIAVLSFDKGTISKKFIIE